MASHAAQPYYLANFWALIAQARDVYGDLLDDSERNFIDAFAARSLPAQCLFVRMLTRRGARLRSDRLNYPEVADVQAAASELAAARLLHIDAPAPAVELLALLTLTELAPLAASCGAGRGLCKAAQVQCVVNALGGAADAVVGLLLRQRFHWYALNTATHAAGAESAHSPIDTLALLFFGNRHQDLSVFVVTQLGHLRFESYALDGMRQFHDREDFDAYRAWLDASEGAALAIAGDDFAMAMAIAQRCIERPPHRFAPARRDRVLVQLARYFERRGDTETALTLADACHNSDEAQQRARLMRARRDPTADQARRPKPLPVIERALPLAAWQPGAAEQLVLSALVANGYQGAHFENQFPCALFGLLFWDILFMPVPGAFFNRFQAAPADLYTADFFARRAAPLQQRLDSIATDAEDWRRRLAHTIDAKRGIANAFVGWRAFDDEQFLRLCDALPAQLAARICARVARDPARQRRGFPDLSLRAPNGELQFCEVKSPNDQLSGAQRSWLDFLRGSGSEAWVARIVTPPLAPGPVGTSAIVTPQATP